MTFNILSYMDGMRAENLIESDISPYDEMIAYETLWAIEGMTEAKLTKLFQAYPSSPTKVLANIDSNSLLDFKPKYTGLKEKVEEFISKKLGKFSIVVNGDYQYPEDLRGAKHPIELFYYKGNLDLLNNKAVSIVGARKTSEEGRLRAARLSKELSAEGYTIVSGLAAGIDTAAQTSAIAHKGTTIGVIGTPIDRYYPKENINLQNTIAKDYLLISQVPFYRYETEHFNQHRFYFPRRNVTMASISQATIIVEASDTSGSLTQARACLAQNKSLFILDSCFKNRSIKWPSTYLEKGAIRVKTTQDILDHL